MLATKTIWGSNDDFLFVTITEDLFDECIDIINSNLLTDGSIQKMIGLSQSPKAIATISLLMRHILEDGASVCAIDKTSGCVASVLLNQIKIKDNLEEKEFLKGLFDRCEDRLTIEFFRNADKNKSHINFFDQLHVNCILDLSFLATKNDYRRKNLAVLLGKYTIELAQAQATGKFKLLKHPNVIIEAITIYTTSNYSHIVAEKLNLKLMHEGVNSFQFDDKFYLPEEHQTYRLFGEKLSNLKSSI